MTRCDTIDSSAIHRNTRRSPILLRPSWIVLVLIGAAGPAALRAEEISALQWAQKTENLLIQVIAAAEPSVVAISRIDTPRDRVRLDQGTPRSPRIRDRESPRPGAVNFVPDEFATGVVVDRDGLILTNYHVLGDLSDGTKRYEYFITTKARKTYPAEILAADPRSDLAVLKLLEFETHDLTPIPMTKIADLKKGRFVIALGNPYAIARDGQASASLGIVANIARKAGPTPSPRLADSKNTLHHYGTLIQTDAKLNLGTSGGPLVNLKGEMVGLTTSVAALVGYEKSAGYAIPVNATFRRIVENLKLGREVEYGFLGISTGNLELDEMRRGLTGMRVTSIVAGTPAERSGLRPGDIITHVDDRPVYDADALILAVGKLDAGVTAHLTVKRKEGPRAYETLSLNTRLAKFPVRGKKIFKRPRSWRGLWVDYATTVLASSSVSLRNVGPCIAVADVEPDSRAWSAGLRPGLLITHVDTTPVENPSQFQRAILGKSGSLKLHIADPDHSGRSRILTIGAP